MTGVGLACAVLRSLLLYAGVLLVVSGRASAITSSLVGSGFSSPLYVTAPPGDAERLFVVEQGGKIKILSRSTGLTNATPFLTINDISKDGERGLLGLAFHPNYASNGRFYVKVTNPSGNAEVREYKVSANPNVATASSKRLILGYAQPFPNHNGGWLAFGPDGYLYIACGDGGSANDPGNRAQNKNSLLGKILRIDLNTGNRRKSYVIPVGNPFRGVRRAAPEIWAYGLRNPWRCSFDRGTGDFLIADVGQDHVEEVNFQPASSRGGINYGWRAREGSSDNPDVTDPAPSGAVNPIHEYSHGDAPDGGSSITGGYVYRGTGIPSLQGTYFFADFITSQIWSFTLTGGVKSDFANRTAELDPFTGGFDGFSSFGEGGDGELFIVSIGGSIFQIVP